MSSLTPRADKNPTLPATMLGAEKQTSVDDQSRSEQVRLAQALEAILAEKTAAKSRVAAPLANLTRYSGAIDRNGPGFMWGASAAERDEPPSTSKSSQRWLQRAQRESRWSRVRRCTQWILLFCGGCAVIALTFWPSAS